MDLQIGCTPKQGLPNARTKLLVDLIQAVQRFAFNRNGADVSQRQ